MKILQRLVWINNGQYFISINNIDMEIGVCRDFLLSIFNSYEIIKNQFLSSNAYYSDNILSIASILFRFHSVCGTFENVLETHTTSQWLAVTIIGFQLQSWFDVAKYDHNCIPIWTLFLFKLQRNQYSLSLVQRNLKRRFLSKKK